MAASKATTVLDVIMSLFPHGYVDHAGYRARLEATGQQHRAPSGRHTSFENPPCSAVDLFALTGQLLLKSGAYHHISPTVAGARIKDKLTVSPAARKRWIASGKSWRGDRSLALPKPPAAAMARTRQGIASADMPDDMRLPADFIPDVSRLALSPAGDQAVTLLRDASGEFLRAVKG